MSATVTVTGVIGPAVTVSATVISGVTSFTIDCVTNVISISVGGVISNIAITSATTITATKSGSTYTLTIS